MASSLPDSIKLIESAINRNLIFDAYNLIQDARQQYPDDVRLTQLCGWCLARLGNTEKARLLLNGIYQSNHQDSETAGLLARVYKDLFKQEGLTEFAHQSKVIYLSNFQQTGDTYTGINAATMSLILGERETAKTLAAEVIHNLQGVEDSYWKFATLGEAKLLLDEEEEAMAAYLQAKSLAESDQGYLSSSYEQLKFISSCKHIPSIFFETLKPASIVVFSGHMIDRPGRQIPRFPDSISEPIKRLIKHQLDEINAGVSFSSAACGADLLFVEAMLERDGEANVYLPFALEDFIKTSVAFAGEKWINRFETILGKVNLKYITEESYLGTEELFLYTGEVMTGLALLTATHTSSDSYFLAVLDRQDTTGRQGGAEDMFKRWPHKENIRIIDPASVVGDIDFNSPVEIQSEPVQPAPAIPFGVNRSLKCILFADIVGYSKIEDEVTPYFVYELLQSVAERLKSLDAQPEVLNTWGDAFFVIYDTPDQLIRYALTLNETVLETVWSKKNLSQETSIRIALHAGPVFVGEDPITHQPNAYGTHISRTARMEPITLPGCIYSSEQFASLLLAETGNRYGFRYVGRLELPKKFGYQDMYQITNNR